MNHEVRMSRRHIGSGQVLRHYVQQPPSRIDAGGVAVVQVKHLLRAVVPRHVMWSEQSGAVFDALRGDFMGDVVHVVDDLLAEGV